MNGAICGLNAVSRLSPISPSSPINMIAFRAPLIWSACCQPNVAEITVRTNKKAARAIVPLIVMTPVRSTVSGRPGIATGWYCSTLANVFSFSISLDIGSSWLDGDFRAMVSRLVVRVVETTGIEPATSGLQSRRSPN